MPVVYNCGGDARLAGQLSGAADYFPVAADAIREMVRQVGAVRWEGEKVTRGVIIRHLILPGNVENSLRVLDWIGENFAPGEVLVSRVTDEEYDAVLSWMYLNELEGFTQEAEAADTGFIPDFLAD